MNLEVGNRQRVWDLLAHQEVDLAIGGRPQAGRPFRTLATRPNHLVLVAPNDASGAGRTPGVKGPVRRVSLAELARSTWLLREPGSGTRGTTEELLRELELSPQVDGGFQRRHPGERADGAGHHPHLP